VLINSAGIAGPPGQRAGNIDYESWAHVFAVNTMGPMRVLESFSDHVARSERRLVVTITSGMGSLADNTSGSSTAYRSSMRSAAIDLAPRDITCVGCGLCRDRRNRDEHSRHGSYGRHYASGHWHAGVAANGRSANSIGIPKRSHPHQSAREVRLVCSTRSSGLSNGSSVVT
jgi:NAD(P)-dependent dehydrogenase (short-subunit alcohol dehydrogenase family)